METRIEADVALSDYRQTKGQSEGQIYLNHLKIQIEFSPNKISSGVVLKVGEFLPGVTFRVSKKIFLPINILEHGHRSQDLVGVTK